MPSLGDILAGAVVYHCVTYVIDVGIRPSRALAQAQQAAAAVGKPLLNVGSGTPSSSFRYVVFGPTHHWGNVNCDIAGSGACRIDRGRGQVCHCDIQELPFADKEFGAAIASHVLEHVSDPLRAMRELDRVADNVFAIMPRWWSPTTWLHPGHKWYYDASGRWRPLWIDPGEAGAVVVGQGPAHPASLPPHTTL